MISPWLKVIQDQNNLFLRNKENLSQNCFSPNLATFDTNVNHIDHLFLLLNNTFWKLQVARWIKNTQTTPLYES